MSPVDRTISARAKLERADEHINNLRIERGLFLKTGAYCAVGQDEPETGDRVVKASISPNVPVKIPLILGDAIHNLRSALDHLARQIVEANGGTPNDDTAFPIFYDRESFEARFEGKVHGARKDVLKLIEILKPYKAGNKLLWALHRFDMIDKHRLLITTAALAPLVVAQLGGSTPLEGFPLYPDGRRRICPPGIIKDGQELYRLPPSLRPNVYNDPRFGFEIGFGEILEGEWVLAILPQFTKLVGGIIDQFSPLL